ncbi:MAG: alpha/beta fold hydrolase [Chloroflexi bacterium]|nr:alpha/beta fold hydrolase [Chloroflexota bacterium]
MSKAALHQSIRNQSFLLKEWIAGGIAALMLTLALAGLWLAFTRSIWLVFALGGVVAVGLLLPFFAAMPVLHPRRIRVSQTPADFGIARWENVNFLAADGVQLRGWFIPPASSTDGPTIVFVHGLGGNRGELLPEAAMLARAGYGALLFDLRNHGRSRGTLTTLGFREVEDVRGAVAYLEMRGDVNRARIGLFGHSMGAATVVRAAARLAQVRVVIAQGAYSSLEENIARGVIAQAGLPPFIFAPLMIWLGERATGLRVNQVRPIDDVASIAPRALLLIHGMRDSVVTVENSRRLYHAANEPKELFLVNAAQHKTPMFASPSEYEKRVTDFLAVHLRGDRVVQPGI